MTEIRCDVERFDVNTSPCSKTGDICGATWVPSIRVRWSGWFPYITLITRQQAQPGFLGNTVSTTTQYFAKFKPGPITQCACCEFRQLIRGSIFLYGFFRVPIPQGPNGLVSATSWKEDKAVNGFSYGHRANPATNNIPVDAYLPARADGCIYMGYDRPRVRCLKDNVAYNIQVDFISFIYDSCNDQGKDARLWSFRCNGVT